MKRFAQTFRILFLILLAGFLGGVSLDLRLSVPGGQSLPSSLLAVAAETASPADDLALPAYKPRKESTPRARVGGGLRGSEGKDPEIQALVPDHVGVTSKKSPSLNWFLSKPTTLPIRFTIIPVEGIRPILEKPLTTPSHEGVQTIRLKDLGLTLEPEVQYRWFVSLIRDGDSPSQDIVTGGIIERCEFAECLVNYKGGGSCDRDWVMKTAESGLWYDAMACLCELIEASPTDRLLRKHRAALLRQVGLHAIAEWDLKEGRTP